MNDIDSGHAEEKADSVTGLFSHKADETEQAISDTLEGDEIPSTLADSAARFENFLREGVKCVSTAGEQVKSRIVHASECTSAYVREEPVKALLMAAATGALLAGAVAWISRSRAQQ